MGRMRPFSPKKEKAPRNPYAPRIPNEKKSKPKRIKTSAPDRWDGGGGSVYHTNNNSDIGASEVSFGIPSKIAAVEAIKRDLKGNERERELRRQFKCFAKKPSNSAPSGDISPEYGTGAHQVIAIIEAMESKAFDAKRLRQIGFDPRRKANEEPALADKKVVPIVGGQKISLDGLLGEWENNEGREVVDGDSDSDLDIVMTS